MKLLVDSCLSFHAVEAIRQAGHDATWAGEWPSDPGDEQILCIASAESRILVTIDKDFGELVMVQGMLHCGLIRLVGFRARDQGTAILRILQSTNRSFRTGQY
ncbi:MAG TPA: DUF5615 family PIN-like protein [Tepidisphaeraceae bacterium]|nr:DUF5615 family PIN-like protein [Tepidisphaeraceae bacterium]